MTISSKVDICILAAGMGTRMKSKRPKALHTIAGKPMLAHLLDTARALNPNRIHVVIGQGGDQIRDQFRDQGINWVEQKEQLGTGHAAMQAMHDFDHESRVLLLVGDAPLLRLSSMQTLLENAA